MVLRQHNTMYEPQLEDQNVSQYLILPSDHSVNVPYLSWYIAWASDCEGNYVETGFPNTNGHYLPIFWDRNYDSNIIIPTVNLYPAIFFIYHEHVFYFSLLSAIEHFKRYDMTIFDIKFIPIHGGSLRFYVCKKIGSYAQKVSNAVKLLEKEERRKGYDKFTSFLNFSNEVFSTKKDLVDLLKKLKSEGFTVAGYGASGRANTIIQYCGINKDLISYMIDDAPAKTGFFTPGSHLEIFPRSILSKKNAPHYVLVFAFSFFEEILSRNKDYINAGGRMILPIPKVKIYPEFK
jgi:hypothetical protein